MSPCAKTAPRGATRRALARLVGWGLATLALAALGAVLGASGCAKAPLPPLPAFETRLDAEDPRSGRIVALDDGAPVSHDALLDSLARARFVLLGERHDQPDHHRLQAWVVSALAARGRRPAVVLEMLDETQREALERALPSRDAEEIARAVRWEKSSWPDFALYRPVIEAALAAGLPIVAGNASTARVRALAMGQPDDDARALLAGAAPLSDTGRARLVHEIDRGHCGQATPERIGAMIEAQRFRDVTMASALLVADARFGDGAVLIAGTGHVARDMGVPVQLAARAPDATIASLAFVELRAGLPELERDARTAAAAGDAGSAAIDADRSRATLAARDPDALVPDADLLWLTPRLDDDDPCTKYREALERMRRAHPPAPKP